MNRRIAPLLGTLLTIFLVGCNSEAPPQSDLRTVSMKIGSMPFTLEVADSFAKRERGLMQRDSMPEGHGMLFVFEDETDRAFWMKNTRIPLDILYIATDGKIVSLKTMRPYDLSQVPSDGPAKYAIELNAGMIQKTGVKVGEILQIPAEAREPAPQ